MEHNRLHDESGLTTEVGQLHTLSNYAFKGGPINDDTTVNQRVDGTNDRCCLSAE